VENYIWGMNYANNIQGWSRSHYIHVCSHLKASIGVAVIRHKIRVVIGISSWLPLQDYQSRTECRLPRRVFRSVTLFTENVINLIRPRGVKLHQHRRDTSGEIHVS
jgi:hypothetical protein